MEFGSERCANELRGIYPHRPAGVNPVLDGQNSAKGMPKSALVGRMPRTLAAFTARREIGILDSRMKSKVYRDPVVEAYMPGVDRTLLRENLRLTPAERLEKLVSFSSFAATLREAGQRARRSKKR